MYMFVPVCLWLCISLDRSDCLFPVVLSFLEYNSIVLYFLHGLVSSRSICRDESAFASHVPI